VVLTGARQTGKTTLVRDLLPQADQKPFVYFSLDDPDERLRLSADPVRLLDSGDTLVILDEVQKQPELLDAVKLLADRDPEKRFLLLGSSQILLLHQVRETLAGRASLLELWPLALSERGAGTHVRATCLDSVWHGGPAAVQQLSDRVPTADNARLRREWTEDNLTWGGYPALEPLPEQQRNVWLRDFRRTYLERDLADLGRVADLDQFALAQNLLAARTAQLLSYSEVARDLGVAVNTIKRYVRFLEISYQVVLLRPLQPTTTARIVKSPKLYWTDVGLARMLTGRTSLNDGPLFETAVLSEFLRWQSWQDSPPNLHFFRTRAGREVDFVLHAPDRLLVIEAKAGRRVHRKDAKPLSDLIRALRISGMDENASRIGIVVSQGREVEQLASSVWSIPYWRLFGPAEQ
jgi:predicted AAA+ superfamily ATPase